MMIISLLDDNRHLKKGWNYFALRIKNEPLNEGDQGCQKN